MDLLPALEGLTDRERVLVEARLRGMSIAMAAGAAGVTYVAASSLLRTERCKEALKKGREISAEATAITRERLTEMLLDAYKCAVDATEQVMAVRELAKLHGLNAATKLEIDHNHRIAGAKTEEDVKALSIHELERLAATRSGDLIEGEFISVPRIGHGQTS